MTTGYPSFHLWIQNISEKTFSYPTDLVHVASISRMTSTIVFRIRCYVSVITEKYDRSFQLTYHTLAFDFQTANAEEHALFNMLKELQCRPTYFKYTDYSTTYHRSAHLGKKFYLEGNQRIQENTKYKEVLHTENTLRWRKIEMVNAP